MSSKYRIILNRITRFTYNARSLPVRTLTTIPKRNIAVPCMLGFSIFTWLGLEKKKTIAEDDLIHTIKHCVLFIHRGDYDKAEQLLHVALRQAEQIRHEKGIVYVYDVMANLALEREQLDKAKQLFIAVTQRIMAEGATEEDPRVVHISAKLARISHLSKEYTTAQIGYEWCLEKLNTIVSREPTKDNIMLFALTEDWYGRLFIDCNKCEQGVQLMIESLNRMRQIDVEKEHIVYQLNDIGTVYDKMDKSDESISYFNEAIQLGKSVKMEDLGTMYVNLGRAYLKKNMIDEARKSCGQGWKQGKIAKNDDVKKEAELCLKQIKRLST